MTEGEWEYRIKNADSAWMDRDDEWRDVTETTVSAGGFRSGFDLEFRRKPKNSDDDDRVQRALNMLGTYGHTDGAHHKAWIVDQAARILAGDGYDAWVQPHAASWDEGIAP